MSIAEDIGFDPFADIEAEEQEDTVEPEHNEESQLPDQVLSTAESEKLMNECCGFRLSIYGTWPGGSKGWDANTKQQVADRLGIEDSRAISGGTLLYDSRCPQIAECNELQRRVKSYVRSMTLPLAQANMDEPRVEGGTYLIRRDWVENAHEQMLAFHSECTTQAQKLNDHRQEVLDASEAMLGPKFVAANYPEEWKLQIRWGFPNVSIPQYLEQLAPEAYEHEIQAVRQRFEDSYQLATETMLGEFSAVVNQWVEKLTPVIRIYPPKGHPLHKYREAEVFERITNLEDPDVPKGHVKVVLRHKPKGKTRLEKIDLEPMKNSEFADLKPTASSSEKKKLYTSTVENLFDVINRFRSLGETISAGPELMALVDEAAANLKHCSNAESAQKALKNNDQFRIQTRELMQNIAEQLDEQIVITKKSRRKLIRN